MLDIIILIIIPTSLTRVGTSLSLRTGGEGSYHADGRLHLLTKKLVGGCLLGSGRLPRLHVLWYMPVVLEWFPTVATTVYIEATTVYIVTTFNSNTIHNIHVLSKLLATHSLLWIIRDVHIMQEFLVE